MGEGFGGFPSITSKLLLIRLSRNNLIHTMLNLLEIKRKKQTLNESGERVMDISFDLESVMNVEPESGETGLSLIHI